MGLGKLFTRDLKYQVTDTDSGQSATYFVTDNISPDWGNVDYQGGMGLPGCWRASILLSDLLGSVPWKAYRSRGNATSEEINPTPPLLEQPAPPDPRVVTFSSMALDLIWHGNAVAVIGSRDRSGWPTSLLPVRAEYVQVKRVEPWDEFPLPEGTLVYGIGTKWYTSADIVHVKGPSRPGAFRGMGIIENHLTRTLALAGEQARQARSLGGSGVPTGVLQVDDTEDDPLTPDEAAKVKAGWLRSQRDRTVAVLNSRTKFLPLAWNPTETQLLEARKFSLHEIALIFGLSPSWLGVSGASMTYSNIESEAINLVKFSLAGHLARFEQTFTTHMPRGTQARANLDAILRADTLSRYQAHAIGLASGFLTVDEVRGMENREPVDTEGRLPSPGTPAPPDPAGTSEMGGSLRSKLHPGNAKELHDYWTRDPAGLAQWADHPHPWTALYHHLRQYITDPHEAKATAAAWYHDAFGTWPGEKGGRK